MLGFVPTQHTSHASPVCFQYATEAGLKSTLLKWCFTLMAIPGVWWRFHVAKWGTKTSMYTMHVYFGHVLDCFNNFTESSRYKKVNIEFRLVWHPVIKWLRGKYRAQPSASPYISPSPLYYWMSDSSSSYIYLMYTRLADNFKRFIICSN